MTDYDGCSDYSIAKDTVVCSIGGNDEECLEIVKGWIKEKKLSSDEVKIMRGPNYISVVTKCEVFIP